MPDILIQDTTGRELGMADVERIVAQFILDNYLFGDASQAPEAGTSLVEAGVIDSTGILELIEFLEAEFDISVAEAETVPANLDSIDNIARYVRAKADV